MISLDTDQTIAVGCVLLACAAVAAPLLAPPPTLAAVPPERPQTLRATVTVESPSLEDQARAGRYFCLETPEGDIYIAKDHVLFWRLETHPGFVGLVIQTLAGQTLLQIRCPAHMTVEEVAEAVREQVLDGLDGPIPVYQSMSSEIH